MARNSRIFNQNLSETTQNHARSFENSVCWKLAHLLIVIPGYIKSPAVIVQKYAELFTLMIKE